MHQRRPFLALAVALAVLPACEAVRARVDLDSLQAAVDVATGDAAVDLGADLSALDAPYDIAADAPVTEPADAGIADSPLPDTATADTATADGAPCTGPTCKGAAYPSFALADFQPKSAGFKTKYGLAKFTGKVTVVALVMGW